MRSCRLPCRPESRSRQGLALFEVLLLLALIAQAVGLLVPAVQKVRAAATRLNNTPWVELGEDIKIYADDVELLARDMRAAAEKALRDREVDEEEFDDLEERLQQALLDCQTFQDQLKGCIDFEESRLVDRQLEFVLASIEALEPVILQNLSTIEGLSFER